MCAGMPAFMKNVPVIGGFLQSVCVRSVQRLLEDVQSAVHRLDSGESWEDLLKGRPPS